MLEFLRDPLWQSIGALLALVAIIISIFVFFAQRKRKSLAYEVVSQTALLSVAEELEGKLKILYQRKPVREVNLLILSLSNNGDTPILASDFVREVSIDFSNSTKILSAEVSETSPDNLNASAFVDGESIKLRPILWNSGDSVTFKILLGQFDGNFNLDGRIIGVKSIAKKAAQAYSRQIISVTLAMMSILLLTLIPTWFYLQSKPSNTNINIQDVKDLILTISSTLSGIIGILGFIIGYYYKVGEQKKK